MGGLEEQITSVVREAVRLALAEAALERPAPYPVSVSIPEAAAMLGVSDAKVREMVHAGELRRMDIPGTRIVIPTLALFELDPGFTDSRRAEMTRLDLDGGES